ncbi:XRE family transcriptional regulator [Alteromonadaceae bacterium M269]|nr:XRE family transcriptional regulator [Alteromonadaceae bacterium M269]
MSVKSLRQKSNWSQEQLAQLSGLNVRTIQRIEKGER